jgi:hypothetical protein
VGLVVSGAGKVHYAPGSPVKLHAHWTVCGRFRGFYSYTRNTADVTCSHCLKWIEAHRD